MRGIERLEIRTTGREQLVDVTDLVAQAIGRLEPPPPAVLLHVPHTTAGVTINEGYDPAVAEDVLDVLRRLVPRDAGYRHLEGNSDSHVKAIATGSSQLVPVDRGAPMLGRWQRIFFCEFDGPRSRQLWVTPIG
jgi:secondary thiamine-phosphate synthase enzyme